MSEQQENTTVPIVSSAEKEVESLPKDTTSNIDNASSKASSSNTTKKRSRKRTSEEILQEIRKETEKEEPKSPKTEKNSSPPPPKKRVKVVASDDEEEEDSETPSFWRGAVAKPLLLAGLGGLTFFVNNWFSTSRPAQPQTSKQKYVQPAPVQKRTVAAQNVPTVPNSNPILPKIQGFSN